MSPLVVSNPQKHDLEVNTLFMRTFHPALVSWSTKHQALLMQEPQTCLTPVPGALGSAVTAGSTPAISAISPYFQENVGR